MTFVLGLSIMAAPTFAGDLPDSLRLPKILNDNMVLQQDKPIHIWGWAKPGSPVKVTLTQDSKIGGPAVEKHTTALKRKPSTEYSVTVKYVEKNAPKLATQTLTTYANPAGRFHVKFKPAKASFRPTWLIAKSEDKTIVLQNILIGEVWVTAGQSNMGWSNFNRKDREAPSADFPGIRYIAWHDSSYKPLDDIRRNVSWQPCTPVNAQRFSAVPYLYAMYLHRYLKTPVGIINVARGGTLGQTWCLRSELDNIDNPIIQTVLKEYDAQTAAWDDPQTLAKIKADYRATLEKAKAEYEKRVAQAKADGQKPPRRRLPKPPADPRSGWSPPAGLFNATIIPIRDLAIRGVLYYQGENNNFMKWTRYEYTFPKVPVSFRKAFNDPKLPFGCISQPGWGTFDLDPEIATVAEGYAIIRDIQRRVLDKDPHGHHIATYPTGNSYIHPGEKLPVAEYASLWALAKVYKKPVVHTGNKYTHHQVVKNKIHLFFDIDPIVRDRWKHIKNHASWQVVPQAREGRAALKGFIIAGKDRRWYPATAKHERLDGKWTIAVTSDLVPNPVAVRYGWANWPNGNLVGRNRLPIPTFRTDSWPIPHGVSYSKEASSQSKTVISELQAKAKRQALDRKIKQAQLDIPKLESELHKGKLKAQLQSKIARLQAIITELQTDQWLSGNLRRSHPKLNEQIAALQKTIEALQAAADGIPD